MEQKKYRALLVEDQEGVAKIIQSGLVNSKAFQFEVERAGDLRACLSRLAASSYDVIVLDLGLPDSSGFSTFEQVKARAGKVPIVVLTGLDDEAVGVRAVEQGAQDFLVKGQMDVTALPRTLSFAIRRAAS
ncbi:MAG: response regulator transcription factor [Candidatus Omnitrophota bacterium]